MYDEARVLYGADHAVVSARAGEGDHVAAGFQDSQDRRPGFGTECDIAAVPLLAHESARGPGERAIRAMLCGRCFCPAEPLDDAGQVVGRIGDARIDLAKARDDVAAIPQVQCRVPDPHGARHGVTGSFTGP